MRRTLFLPFAVLAIFGVFLLSPWITREAAEQRTEAALQEAWSNVADGCGINCNGCGAVQSERAPFGVLVRLEYGCGMLPADTPENHERIIVFVSSLGTVHGIPRP